MEAFPIGFPIETGSMPGHRSRYFTTLKSHNFLMRKYFLIGQKINDRTVMKFNSKNRNFWTNAMRGNFSGKVYLAPLFKAAST